MPTSTTILFDDQLRDRFLPLAFTKPIAHLRIGVLTMAEKWKHALNLGPAESVGVNTQTYLRPSFPLEVGEENLLINARYFPSDKLIEQLSQLHSGEALFDGDVLVARRLSRVASLAFREGRMIDPAKEKHVAHELDHLSHIWEMFSLLGREISKDFDMLTKGRSSAALPAHVTHFGEHPVFIEEGAALKPCMINTESGPVYIGKNALVMEGSLLRGPLAICEGAVVKMGAKIYKDTSIGPYSKVGGEISNSSFQAYSNKGHDGYLGNSLIGEWCNLGADTNNSNLKNNYKPVKLWDYVSSSFTPTGLQFCGLIMGDHSKCGINTMFNTGTVVGVSANIFGEGFPRNFIPSFSWGGANKIQTYKFEQAMETAAIVMKRRNIALTDEMRDILHQIYTQTNGFRTFENTTAQVING